MNFLMTNQPGLSRKWYKDKCHESGEYKNAFGFYEESDDHYRERIKKKLEELQDE